MRSKQDEKRFSGDSGYVWIKKPGHRKATYNGNLLEHLWVMEAYLGRSLPPGTIVHHRNRKRHDNQIENLLLLRSEDDHLALHRAMDAGDGQLIQAYEVWSRQFMEKLKAGLPLEDCYKNLTAPRKIIVRKSLSKE